MEQIAPQNFHIDADDWPPLRARVNAETDGCYLGFRNGLAGNYPVVWRDLATGYAALALVLVLVALPTTGLGGLAAAALGAVGVGAAIAYLQLFIHEGAHWNLARDRKTSDRLADWLLAWHVGTSISAYRRVHFDHHRHFGQTDDGEKSYANRLSWRLMIEMVTGVHALRVFLARRKRPASRPMPDARNVKLPLLRGLAIHALLLAGMLGLGAWAPALAWVGGIAIFFPLFATLRPLLEHRPAQGDSALLQGDRAATTRLFADSAFAAVFGGAGFSRHLLHHWEPGISYTRLADLEAYLQQTSVGTILDARRTTYGQAFREIMASDTGRDRAR